ncbi:MAG: hypothetical protein WC877_00300 [Dehalococcoidales bacterium]|jgi:hypothetical protein
MLIEISLANLYIVGVVIMFSGIIAMFVFYDNVIMRTVALFIGMLASMWVYSTFRLVIGNNLEE